MTEARLREIERLISDVTVRELVAEVRRLRVALRDIGSHLDIYLDPLSMETKAMARAALEGSSDDNEERAE
jgi:hypothetical protein